MSYRIRNWSEYNAGLKQRGSVTFWLDEAVIAGCQEPSQSGRRGASRTYSDLAIATFETLRELWNHLFALGQQAQTSSDHEQALAWQQQGLVYIEEDLALIRAQLGSGASSESSLDWEEIEQLSLTGLTEYF